MHAELITSVPTQQMELSQPSAATGQAQTAEQPSVIVSHPQLYGHAEQLYQVSSLSVDTSHASGPVCLQQLAPSMLC